MNWPCLFGHGDWRQGRDAAGKMIKVCERCLQPIGHVLDQPVVIGPQSQPAVVLGQPKGKARLVRQNVSPRKVSSR